MAFCFLFDISKLIYYDQSIILSLSVSIVSTLVGLKLFYVVVILGKLPKILLV